MNNFFKFISLIFFAIVLAVNFSSAANGEIVHISCKESSRVFVDRNFVDEPQTSRKKEYVRTFDLKKQLLLDTDFKGNKPLAAFIDSKTIYWHSILLPKPKQAEALKSKYNQDVVLSVGTFQINRYTGKMNTEFYGLDKAYFAKYFGVGGREAADQSKFKSILTKNYNSKEGLRIKKRVIEQGKRAIKNQKIQKDFIVIGRSEGNCKKTSSKKKF